MAVALALALFRAGEGFPGFQPDQPVRALLRFMETHGPPFWILPIAFGGLAFLNTWDFPIYTGLGLAAWGLGAWRAGRSSSAWLREIVGLGIGILSLGWALYFPFYLGFRSQAGGLLPNFYNGTRLPQFMVMFGFQVVGLVAWLLAQAWRAARDGQGSLRSWVAGVLGGALGLGLVPVALWVGLYYALRELVWYQDLPLPVSLDALEPWVWGRLRDGTVMVSGQALPGSGPWVPMLLAGIAIGAVRLWRRENKEDEAFIRLLIVSGAALAWAVEFFYIRDFFGTRMNTVFKLYYQVWVLWSLALAWAMGALWERSDRARPAFALGFAATIALAVLYPILMIPIKAEFFLRLPTLDGYAHLARSAPDDLAAIEWLNAHVRSTPVILEAPGWGGISFQPEIGRFSAHTGLPTVLGWGGHEHQWRGSYAEMARREPDLRILWQSPDLEQTLELLEKYEIVYVIVGQTERRLFSPSVLRKFELLMDPVFRSGETVIYRRRE
jgi:YYY domain-containing protein